MKKIFLAIFFLNFSIYLSAQADTLLTGYPCPSGFYCGILRMTPLSNNQYALAQFFDGGAEITITNENGIAVNKKVLEPIDGYDFISCSHIFEGDGELFFLCTAFKSGYYYPAMLKSDFDLTNIEIHSLLKGQDYNHVTETMKYNTYKNVWEGFGITFIIDQRFIENNFYIKISPSYHLVEFKLISSSINSQLTHILDAIWSPKSNSYVWASFAARLYEVNEEMIITGERFGTAVRTRGDTTFHISISAHDLFLQPDSTIFCVSRYSFRFTREFANHVFIIDLLEDSVVVNRFVPLNDPPLDIWQFHDGKLDKKGNLILSGVNNHTAAFFPTVPNILTVAKFDNSFNRVWNLKISNGYAYVVFETAIDNENNVLVVGVARNMFGDHRTTGFLLKIFEDGTFTVSYDDVVADQVSVSVYPNPLEALLKVEIAGTELKSSDFDFSIFDNMGIRLLDTKLGAGVNDVSLPTLPAGIYYYQVWQGSIFIRSGKLVKAAP